jgi:hypothetical protein
MIVVALVEAKAHELADAIVSRWKDAPALLMPLIANASADDFDAAAFAAALPVEEVVGFAQSKHATESFVIAAVRAFDESALTRLPQSSIESLLGGEGKTPDDVVAILLSHLSLQKAKSAAPLAVAAYVRLYGKAKLGTLTPKARKRLEARLVHSGSSLAESLAETLNSAFRKHAWDAEELLSVTDAEAFSAVLEADTDGQLAQSVAKHVAEARRRPKQWQEDAIISVLVRNATPATFGKLLKGVWRRIPF